MNLYKIIALVALTIWSCSVWHKYWEKKKLSQQTHVVDNVSLGLNEDINKNIYQSQILSDSFWKWEAQGRIRFIDDALAHPIFTAARTDHNFEEGDLKSLAEDIIFYQMRAYGVHTTLEKPKIIFTPLRGDANGLYMPIGQTIYLNTKMKWHGLGFERFAEVVLHENMHHILTNRYKTLSKDNHLHSDFKFLAIAALSPNRLAQDQQSSRDTINPQELVAYKTQRAARYTGILNADLTAWETSARTQEIRVIQDTAGY